jgi:AcrR family transcriptional regulator
MTMARPKTQTTLSRKDQIVQQAAQLFKARGYNATTMRHLAEQVNMEASSLYNHISSKEEILQEICFSVANDFNSQLAALEKNQQSPGEKIEAIIRFHIHMMLTRFEAVYVSNRDWKHLKEPALTQFLQQRRQYENKLAAIIAQGISVNQFRPVQPQVAVLGLLSAVRSIEFWQRNKRGISSHQLTEDLVTLLLKGIKN